jgi:zinc transport system ATP-binding protein
MDVKRPPAVEIKGLDFSYESTAVLSDVNLRVEEGDFVSFVGPNGGGKTTLLKLLLGLLKPQSGSVTIFGETPATQRSVIGYVPQYFQFDMSFPVKVMDVVLMGRLDRHPFIGHYGSIDRVAACKALQDVGLYDLRDRPFSALSGGQRQRVLIARALACEPRLFLLDEPTANIDPAVQDDLYKLLSALNERLTIIMVTHDIGFVTALVKRVVCINRTALLHPIAELTGETFANLYGSNTQLVQHDHQCSEKGHRWPNS